MIVLGKRVRLTHAEQIEFHNDTAVQQPPETVDEYNAAITAAVAYWQAVAERENSGEAKFLAALLSQKLIP